MNPRHEKHKPHLVKQYKAQINRIEKCVYWALILFIGCTNDHMSVLGTFFSNRFKK